jgi:hypothetical protein
VSGEVRSADGGGAPYAVSIYEGAAGTGGTGTYLGGVMSDAGPAFAAFSGASYASDAGWIIVWLQAGDSRCVDFDDVTLTSP